MPRSTIAPVVEDDDLIGVANRRQAVRDRDRRAPLGQPFELGLDRRLGLGVERACGLVEHQHRRVAQDRAGDRHPLLLAAREAVAALADDRVVAVRERGDQVVDSGGPGGVLDLLVGGVRAGEAQVLADAGVEQVGLLGDHADCRRQRFEARIADVDPVDRDPPLLRLVQPRDQVAERGLARAGLADDRGSRAGRDDQIDVAQRPIGLLGRPVAEPHAFEADLPEHLRRAQAHRVLGLVDVDRQVEVLEDPVEQGQRRLDVGAYRQQRPDREQQAGLQRRERDHRADRQRCGRSTAVRRASR